MSHTRLDNQSVRAAINELYRTGRAADIADLDVSDVTDMQGLFCGRELWFDLSRWNVSRVTNLNHTFHNATFTGPTNLGRWDVSRVTTMRHTFAGAATFNEPIGAWNVSRVQSMCYLFYDARAFNQPLNAWNTAAVQDLTLAFGHAHAFNQPIGTWNTSALRVARALFYHAHAFNQPLNTWNTASVTTMESMFNGATAFNQPLADWRVHNVTHMNNMLVGAHAFRQRLGPWSLPRLQNMYHVVNPESFEGQLDWHDLPPLRQLYYDHLVRRLVQRANRDMLHRLARIRWRGQAPFQPPQNDPQQPHESRAAEKFAAQAFVGTSLHEPPSRLAAQLGEAFVGTSLHEPPNRLAAQLGEASPAQERDPGTQETCDGQGLQGAPPPVVISMFLRCEELPWLLEMCLALDVRELRYVRAKLSNRSA